MPDHYDRLESRPPSSRETALFRDLRQVLTISKPRLPALRAQLRGVEIAALTTRADLVKIPPVRQADLLARQAEAPPLGGISAMRASLLKQVFLGAGRLVSAEGQARDWWGFGRALYAAGLRKGTLVINCFAYDLSAEGHMAASGAAALSCPVIPAGGADIDRKLEAIVRLRPGFFCGRGAEFKSLIDRADDLGIDVSCITHALVTGPSSKGQRGEYDMRGHSVRHVFMRPEFGAVAFETDSDDLMTIGEGYLVEILDPETGTPAATGQSGELVVTRINGDCPLLRYATGAIASVVSRPSPCGRTNMRIATPHMRAPDSIDIGEQRIHISDIREIAKHHPTIGRFSLVMRRGDAKDVAHLRVEHVSREAALIEGLSQTLRLVTRLCGTVELVAPGTLADDEPVIVDERHLN